MAAFLLLPFFFAIASLQQPFQLLALQGDCPLDFGWSNFTSAAYACSIPSDRGKCCRYINAFVAISIARYANDTGQLGVPSAFSDICLDTILKTMEFYGIPPNATNFCGLGTKIRISYQCEGRETVMEMLQSSGFNDVVGNCRSPLSLDNSCKRCLNSGIVYLHRLIGPEDNVTLSVCRNAAFVTLANQGDNVTAIDMASCFFGVEGLIATPETTSQLPALTTHQGPVAAEAQAPPSELTAPPTKEQHNRHPFNLTLIMVMGIIIIAGSFLLLTVLIFLIRRKGKELKSAKAPFDTSWDVFSRQSVQKRQEGSLPMFRRFSYKETKKATQDFSNVVGRGGFGTVYKAQFSNGSVAAVKRMDKISRQGEDEFSQEMELLGRLHHRHLVALKGFCIEKHERFLIYEYMENGSLDEQLHSPGRNPLGWQTRLQIAIDVANALEYLHFYCDPPLCHRDIKSSNILLDENFTAKVADFGLAHASRSGAITFEPVNTDIRGTPGYMDPEYVVTHELTEKSDVYSYGVLLLELVTGRKAIQDKKNLVEWSQKFLVAESMLPELVDPVIRNSFDLGQLHVLVEIIQWCTQKESQLRPSIKQVLRMLAERLDPGDDCFSVCMEDDRAGIGCRLSRGRSYRSEMIPRSGDARGLRSSSSTSRSYCSRSVLLESGSPQSPTGMFSL